jgi:hypothetical protein
MILLKGKVVLIKGISVKILINIKIFLNKTMNLNKQYSRMINKRRKYSIFKSEKKKKLIIMISKIVYLYKY